ncbi:MAG TPA: hypothetical protein VJB11_04160 [archaeon]|nr:hypothetical protein [archaeon]
MRCMVCGSPASQSSVCHKISTIKISLCEEHAGECSSCDNCKVEYVKDYEKIDKRLFKR